MDIIQVVGIGLVATVLILILKEHKPLFAFSLTVFTGVIIFFLLVKQIAAVIRVIERLAVQAEVNLIYLETILKIIGVAYIAEFGAQITRDAGQGAIAAKIELAGKVLILIMAIPIVTVIIETVVKLLPA
ncbi:stage III sporulation protein AD [Calditerricola satsumensis]|uniref:Stage III sporulation protein AD n=1 Tax=Calditerricola satsumensis TaxID=373054 RepID=A0A8J3BAK5_9BACI|nr:stage III sporulation protein AD [Calditerricola satsumensis]GGJ99882.1 stage III sporulation protein AD [Calditerricola satsumensis]